MVQQMKVPQAVIQVRNEIPGKLQKHAGQKFVVAKRQNKYVGQFDIRCFFIRVFFGAGLNEDVDQYQHKGKVTEEQNQSILVG